MAPTHSDSAAGPAEGSRDSAADDVSIEIETEIERRRSPRASLIVRVRYGSVDAVFSEFTRNVNEGGVFIKTGKPAAAGTLVHLEFELPGGAGTIKASGRVTHAQDRENAYEPAGMGVRFEDLDADARERINEFVRRLRSPA
jgi:uncharacterized protein (TIGR02266 family)